MRKMHVASGWLARTHETVQVLLVGGLLGWGLPSLAAAETYYGMPVVKTLGGYKIVDVRPALSQLRCVNDRARTAFGLVRASTPLSDVSISGWKSLTLTANQLAVSGGRNVPSGSKYFLFTPRSGSSMWSVGAMYYANGAWNGATIGASRENKCDHLYDLTDGKYSSAGAFFHGWCLPWPKTYPTVALMMDGNKVTYGVVINGGAAPPPAPAAPSNTYVLIQKSATWEEAQADAQARGGNLATITSAAEWSNVLKQLGTTLLDKSVWLGGSDLQAEGTWRWVTGEAWSYSRWATGQPNNNGSSGQHRLQLLGSTGANYQWDDQNNTTLSYYLLERAGPPVLTIGATSSPAPAAGASGQTLPVTANVPWTATASQPWITFTAGASGSGNGTVTFRVAVNPGAARSGTIVVAGHGLARTFTVSQTAAALEIRPAAVFLPGSGGGSRQIAVIANVPWTATDNQAWISISGASGSGNGAVTYQVAANGPAVRSGILTVTAGELSRTCTVNQWSRSATPGVSAESDFDGDGTADLAVFHPATGNWDLRFASGVRWQVPFGWSAVVPVPADYDGDGLVDVAVYNPASGTWYIFQTSSGETRVESFGSSATLPVPGDYDDDGKADLAVYHPATARWSFRLANGTPDYGVAYGWSEVIPVPADYDGDGATDLAVYHPAGGNWYLFESGRRATRQVKLGGAKALPIPADYDGDGKADVAVFTRSSARWQVAYSGGGSLATPFGWSAVVPIPADYDGDGAADLAVYHPAGGNAYVLRSTTGTTAAWPIGGPGKNPVLLAPLIHSGFRLP